MRTALVLLLLSFIYPVSPVFSQVYKWVDEKGTTHFSDAPPAGKSGVVVIDMNMEASSTASPEPETGDGDTANPKPPPSDTATGSHQVDLYVTDWCPYCKKAENFFRSRNIKVSVYDIEKDERARMRKEKLDGRSGVPFAVINGQKVHGYSEAQYIKALGR